MTLNTAIPAQAKWTFSTRRVNRDDVASLDPNVTYATAGDLVLCRITQLGQHKKLQLSDQRYSLSYPGDVFVACVGDRYAPDQFEGRAELSPDGVDLIAGGGIVGLVETAHGRMNRPTQVQPLGLLVDAAGEVMNVARYAMPHQTIPDDVTVLGVFGASMNAGKTTAAVSLAHGLARAGFNVAGIKATGTGAFGDFNAFMDAGVPVTDFTDAGMPTTYRMPMERIERGFETLVGNAAAQGAEIAVVEIADGVFQRETSAILEGSPILKRMDGLMFAAPDALGSVGGVQVLQSYGVRPMAVSGMVTCSPLATREAMRATGVPHLSRAELCDPVKVMSLVSPLMRRAGLLQKTAA
ncbi:dethiobiotin synthase [Thalassococcus sp. S3]|uniref:dethiobiotin synthase n=1 Tax=Thalassococcus sp. S3 TaxID=2017482 RepID=UPI0010241910|nr:dethiobiotin synthase [Thalassococcus sp. S3]QBF30705.1 hypothetical protein CFI11_24385 [Thalassococcus sp. S3]